MEVVHNDENGSCNRGYPGWVKSDLRLKLKRMIDKMRTGIHKLCVSVLVITSTDSTGYIKSGVDFGKIF